MNDRISTFVILRGLTGRRHWAYYVEAPRIGAAILRSMGYACFLLLIAVQHVSAAEPHGSIPNPVIAGKTDPAQNPQLTTRVADGWFLDQIANATPLSEATVTDQGSSLIGLRVVNGRGDALGKVAAVLSDPLNRDLHFLGLGSYNSEDNPDVVAPAPVTSFRMGVDGLMVLNVSVEFVDAAPRINRDYLTTEPRRHLNGEDHSKLLDSTQR